jgi:hypothetical protein
MLFICALRFIYCVFSWHMVLNKKLYPDVQERIQEDTQILEFDGFFSRWKYYFVFVNFFISLTHLKNNSSVYVLFDMMMIMMIQNNLSLVRLFFSFFFHLNTSCQMRVLSRLSTMSEQHTSLKFDLCWKSCHCRYAHRSWLKLSTCHQLPARWTHPKRKLIYQNLYLSSN